MGVVEVDSPSRLLVGFPEVHCCSFGHRGGGCRCSSGCCGNCGCRCVDHFGGFSDHTDRPGHRRNGHSHRSGRRGSGHDRRPISFGRCRDGNRRHGADGQVTMVTRYHYYGRTDASPAVSMCF